MTERYKQAVDPYLNQSMCVLLHIYSPELLSSILRHIVFFPPDVSILVSTSECHIERIEQALLCVMPEARLVCRSVPNIGWDIAPMLITFSDELKQYELVCKLHAEKSVHQGGVGAWREFLLQNLAGSAEIVQDIRQLFRLNPSLGLLFPSGFLELKQSAARDSRALERTREVCSIMKVDPLAVSDFPAGSMYWFRPDALRSLLDRTWRWEAFEIEQNAMHEGCLAHGVERSVLSVVQKCGFSWQKHNYAGGERRADQSFRRENGAGVAVVLHIWSMEGILDLIRALKNISFEFDLLVSVSTDIQSAVTYALQQHFPQLIVRIVLLENRGHDIGPFIALAEWIAEYELVCKLHFKHRSCEWNRYLLDNLLGGVAEVNCILGMFARAPSIGVIYPRTFPPVEKYMSWGSNFQTARLLSKKLGIPEPDPGKIEFASGSMFWFRPASLAKLFNAGIDYQFEQSDVDKIDGTLSHAIERLMLHIAHSAGYTTHDVLFHPFRGDSRLKIY